MDSTIVASIIGLVGGIGGVVIGVILSNKNAINILKKQECFTAASKFKSAVIYELIGFYPIDQYWEEKDFHRIYSSIPKINIAAAEFRHFVVSKTDFDRAISEYNRYCRETTEQQVFILDFSKDMPDSKSKNDYMEEFKNIVDHLLSFSDSNLFK